LDVLAAVAHAHANLIVHRDIKPTNVVIGHNGQVKLLDFSIAKLLEGETESGMATVLTVDGARAMTPRYAAPEQLKGEPVTTATDVYALGVLLYILLTGQHPVGPGSRNPAELVVSIVDKEPTRLSEAVSRAREDTQEAIDNAENRGCAPDKLCRVLAGDLETIVAKALKKERTERYLSVTALADDLRRYLKNQPISARPDRLVYRAAKFVRRNRTVVVLAVLAAMATIAGVIGTLMQTRLARAQRDFAFRQMESSEVLNEFHEFLLSDAAPSGKPFTVDDLLDRASRIIDRQHAANDPNRLRLMMAIGHQYLEQDEASKARPLLQEAYKLSRLSADISIRSKASCMLGVSISQADGSSQAETLFHEGLSEIPADPQYAMERINCLRSGAEIAVQRGNATDAVSRAQTAQSLLRASRFDSESLELGSWIDLATAFSVAGRDEEALSAFEQASALLMSLGRDQTENAAVLFCNWGLELDLVGRPLEAEEKYRKAIDIERTGNAEDVSPMLLANYSRTLEELGHLREAEDYASRAYSRAERIGYGLVEDISLFEIGRIAVAQGDISRADSIFDQSEPRLRKRFAAGHYGFAILAEQRSLIALANGNVDTAASLANQAVSMDEAAIATGGDGAHDLPGLLTSRSTIQLAASHADIAAADARRAVKLLEPKMQAGSCSSVLGRAYLALGRALSSQGKPEEARRAFRSALFHLQTTVGSDHPDTRTASRLAELAEL
jgi:serine/threonine-protein kinase